MCSSRLGAQGDKLLSRRVYNPSRQRGPGGSLLGSHCSNLNGQAGQVEHRNSVVRRGLPTCTGPTDNAQGAVTLGSSYVWKKGKLAAPEAQHHCALQQKEQKHTYSVGVIWWFQHGVGKCQNKNQTGESIPPLSEIATGTTMRAAGREAKNSASLAPSLQTLY